jgi:VPDSG-CTERM motif
MKTTSSLRKLFQPVLATLAIAITCGISAPAQANYIVTLEQVGSNVVATGTGAFDLTGLSFAGSNSLGTGIHPSLALAGIGPDGSVDEWDGTAPFAGPTNFGPGPGTSPDSSSGDTVGNFPYVFGAGVLFVPVGYTSGNLLSDSLTFNNQTFSSLGVTPGTYVWSWGTGANQNFTLVVPDSGSTFGLLVLSLAGLFGAARFRSLRVA